MIDIKSPIFKKNYYDRSRDVFIRNQESALLFTPDKIIMVIGTDKSELVSVIRIGKKSNNALHRFFGGQLRKNYKKAELNQNGACIDAR